MTGVPTAPSTSEAKLPEDLPPSYDAIFPGPVPEKRWILNSRCINLFVWEMFQIPDMTLEGKYTM